MIGLDTGHLVYNYGTKLQAYAMQTLLDKMENAVKLFSGIKGILEYLIE